MNNNFYEFDTKKELHVALSTKVSLLLKKCINDDGVAFIAFSGGSTPKPFLEILSKEDIKWDKVLVTLVDERWVDNTNNDSNEKLLKEHFFINKASKATFIPLKNSAFTPHEGLKECNNNFSKLNKDIDIAVLGMGEDGHTASFFPNDINLQNALTTGDFCAATIPSDAPHQRITLSLNTILKAKYIFLHIEGEKKKSVYDKALEDKDINLMPIRAILHNKKQLEVYYGK